VYLDEGSDRKYNMYYAVWIYAGDRNYWCKLHCTTDERKMWELREEALLCLCRFGESI